MAIQKVILNTITNDSEKAHPQGFEVAPNNSVLLKNNSGNYEWKELTSGKMFYGSPTGVILIDVYISTDLLIGDDNHLMTTGAYFKDKAVQISETGVTDVITATTSGINTLTPKKSFFIGDTVNNSSTPFDNPNPGTPRKVLMFDQDKGAFRVGEADTDFDGSNVNNNTIGLGNYNSINGSNSIALGHSNDLPMSDVIAIGSRIKAKASNVTYVASEANDLSGAEAVHSQSGKVTFVSYESSNSWSNMQIDGQNGVDYIYIDNTKAGYITLDGIFTAVRDNNNEYHILEVSSIWAWNAGGAMTELNSHTRQIARSGTSRSVRFRTLGALGGNSFFFQMRPNANENVISTANFNFSIVYRG